MARKDIRLNFLIGNAREIAEKMGPGWHYEDRPTGAGVIMPTLYRGSHHAECIRTENGWICSDIFCTVKDINATNNYTKEFDELSQVIKKFNRVRILKWRYEVFRLSTQRKFVNGRSMKERGLFEHENLWYQGYAWFRRSAKKKAERDIDAGSWTRTSMSD